MFELHGDQVARLRDRLNAVDYTVDGVRRLLGPVAHAALHRNETTPGLRATADDPGPLATLVRLFLLQSPVPASRVDAALPELVEPLVRAGILFRYGDQISALVDLRPYGSVDADGVERRYWVAADLTPGMDGARPTMTGEHVLGVNSAATTLAQITVRDEVGSALDLGTGCGVQALHLSSHAQRVVGTDINPRALALAGFTARLNDVEVELREGNLFDPVQGERFDLIVSNPPFVISPRSELVYREGGLAGDELCRRLVLDAPRHLTEGGTCQLLANWLHVTGEDWHDRLGTWLGGSGCDAWIIEREVSDPAEYVELWLKDAGLHGAPEYQQRYDEWLDWLDAQRVEGIGFGWITMRRTGAGTSRTNVRIESWPHHVEQPLGPVVGRWYEVGATLRETDDAMLMAARPTVAAGIHQEQIGAPGAADPSHIVLRQRTGLCRERVVDTALAGFVGACDGELAVGQIIGALARLLLDVAPDSPDAADLATRLLPMIRELIADGFLEIDGSRRSTR
ncbi:MAG TPA: methyltransferase [Actinopolymorphaceae bacterium]